MKRMRRKKPRAKSRRHDLLIPAVLSDAIDRARGKTPRNRWINERCAEAVGLPVELLTRRGKPK